MAVAEAGNRRRKALIAMAVAWLLALPFAYSAVVVPLSAGEQAEVSLCHDRPRHAGEPQPARCAR